MLLLSGDEMTSDESIELRKEFDGMIFRLIFRILPVRKVFSIIGHCLTVEFRETKIFSGM